MPAYVIDWYLLLFSAWHRPTIGPYQIFGTSIVFSLRF